MFFLLFSLSLVLSTNQPSFFFRQRITRLLVLVLHSQDRENDGTGEEGRKKGKSFGVPDLFVDGAYPFSQNVRLERQGGRDVYHYVVLGVLGELFVLLGHPFGRRRGPRDRGEDFSRKLDGLLERVEFEREGFF